MSQDMTVAVSEQERHYTYIQYQFQTIQWPLTWICTKLLLDTDVWVAVRATIAQSVQW